MAPLSSLIPLVAKNRLIVVVVVVVVVSSSSGGCRSSSSKIAEQATAIERGRSR